MYLLFTPVGLLSSPNLCEYFVSIHVTNNRHFAFVYLLGKLDYNLYSQRNDNRLYMSPDSHMKQLLYYYNYNFL